MRAGEVARHRPEAGRPRGQLGFGAGGGGEDRQPVISSVTHSLLSRSIQQHDPERASDRQDDS
jgi:hypothetical protein